MAQDFNTQGGYFAPAGYFRINTGGSHDENPNGGVQIGTDAQGVPNMLEENESVYNDYVFSDNIIANADILKKYFIPYKYGGKLYSEIADALINEAEERPLDHTSNNGVSAMLTRLADAQEEQKQMKEQAELEEELANMSPEELAQLEQFLAQEESMQQPAPQEAMVPDGMQQPEAQPLMMANGGLLHTYEDGTPGEIVQTVPLDYVPETGNVKGGARTYAEQPFGPAPDTGHITQYVDTRTPVRKAIDNIVDSTPSLRHAKEGFDRFDDTLLGGVSQLLVPSADGVAAAGLLGGFAKIVGGGRGLAKVAKGKAKLGKVSEQVGEAIGKYGDDLVASTSEAAKAASNTASKSEAALQTIRGSRNASKAERAAAENQIREIAKDLENPSYNDGDRAALEELLDEMIAKFDNADSALKNSLFESIGKRFSAIKDKAEKGISSFNEKVAKAAFNKSEKADKAQKTATKLNPKVKTALKWGAGLAAGSALVGGVAKGVDIAQSSNSEEFAIDPFAYGGPIHRFDEESKMDRSGGVTGALQIQPAGSPLWIDLAHQEYHGPYALGQSPQELAAAGNTGAITNPPVRKGSNSGVPTKTRGPVDKIAADTNIAPFIKSGVPLVNTDKYKKTPIGYYRDGDYATKPGLANPNYVKTAPTTGTTTGENEIPVYSTLLEYAHPLYSLLSAGVNMFQRPDKYKFQRATPRIPYMSVPSIIDPEYRAIDVNRTMNDISAAGAGNIRAALNSGAGPGVGTLVTSLDNQMTGNMGNARESIAQFNNNAYNNVIGQRNQNAFHRAQLMFELARARANAEAAADTQNIAMDMREQMMNNQAEQQWANSVGSSLDAFTGDLSKIGLRNQNLNAANASSLFGYWRAPDGTIWRNGSPINQSSCGGTLLKAIK